MPKPDTAIDYIEGYGVIYEGFCFAVVLGGGKCMGEEFFDEFPGRGGFELLVED